MFQVPLNPRNTWLRVSLNNGRPFVALALAFLILLTPLAPTPAQQPKTVREDPQSEHFVFYRGLNGDFTCREATPLEAHELNQIKPQGLQPITHQGRETRLKGDSATAENVNNLTIILRATAQLEANAPAKAAFIRAAQVWEGIIKSPITIYLDVDFGTTNFGQPWDAGTIGATSTPNISSPYQSVRGQLIAGASTSDEIPLYSSLLPSVLPTNQGDGTVIAVSQSIARAIGLADATATDPNVDPNTPRPRIGFNSAFAYDFDSSNGINANETDFEAVATHEIGHALGFTSRAGRTPVASPAIWDIFRFRTGTTLSTFGSAPRIMTADGRQFYFSGPPEKGLSTGGADGQAPGGDGQQSSHWRDDVFVDQDYIGIMDPTIAKGVHLAITDNDKIALDSFGYNLTISVPPPPPPPPPPAPANDDFANAQVVSGCSGTLDGTNFGADRESGEPFHDSANPPNGGGSTVWYQWQAPFSGTITITTAGSNYDTMLAVYTGNSVDSTTVVLQPNGTPAKNDDVQLGVITTSTVTFNAIAGTNYRIAVDGWGGDAGSIILNWSLGTCTPVWQSTTLAGSQVEIKTWTVQGRTFAYVKLIFPTAGYRVTSWGSPVQSGSDFSVDTSVEQFLGSSTQALKTTAQIYDLGLLATGNYSFTLKTSGATVVTQPFTVNPPPPPANPIDDQREFVRRQYLDFLNREPDTPGWDFWTDNITKCHDDARRPAGQTVQECLSRQRETTSAAFFVSPEFQNTGYFVLRVYRGSLGRMPLFGGASPVHNFINEFTRDHAAVSAGIVVNDQLDAARINGNKQALVNGFVLRAEFRAAYGGLNNEQYVDKLFQTTSIAPTAAERQQLIDGLTNGSETRASVLFKVVDGTNTVAGGALVFQTRYGQLFYEQQYNPAFVQMEYFGYMRRDPDDAGFAFWLAKMNQFGNGNFVGAEMVLAFILSPEYRSRFGAP